LAVVLQNGPGNGVCVTVHAPPEHVTIVSHSMEGSVPYSHASRLVAHEAPAAGIAAGQAEVAAIAPSPPSEAGALPSEA
jgi:hypothetical protein